MSNLKNYLFNQDIGVRSSGDSLHIALSAAEIFHAAIEIFEGPESYEIFPTITALGEATIGGATIVGTALAISGPVLGMTGVFMALGSGYEKAREEIQNEATMSGFSQGFVAGLLNMSAVTVSLLFGRHDVIHKNAWDPEADVIEMNAYNRGLVAGYGMANLVSQSDKKTYIFEIREFTGDVSVGDWGDRDKINYVIEYAAKLRLHFLNVDMP